MRRQGRSVVGVEPCNAPVLSRSDLRRRDMLPELRAGESRDIRVDIGVASGASEIQALGDSIRAMHDGAVPTLANFFRLPVRPPLR